jgi:16S rRNA (cytosine967-C5)-methyltransferase
MIDAPCSGLGVLRREPDTKWRMNPGKLAALSVLQRDILERYAPLTRSGGYCLYATCSMLREENEDRVTEFLSRHAGEWLAVEQWRLGIGQDGGDGYYAALLQRRTSGSC